MLWIKIAQESDARSETSRNAGWNATIAGKSRRKNVRHRKDHRKRGESSANKADNPKIGSTLKYLKWGILGHCARNCQQVRRQKCCAYRDTREWPLLCLGTKRWVRWYFRGSDDESGQPRVFYQGVSPCLGRGDIVWHSSMTPPAGAKLGSSPSTTR